MGSISPNTGPFKSLIDRYRPELGPLEEIYKDIHQNPELSGEEERTADIAARYVESIGDFVVHRNVGGHGVVALLKKGDGPTAMLRADMDALPHEEQTGLPYASTKVARDRQGKDTPVMHACGHDMPVALLMGTAQLLHSARNEWTGTLVCIFQPAEELAEGANAMVNDGLYDYPKYGVPEPDIVIGQHMHALRAGQITLSSGPILTAIDSYDVRIFGRSGHVCRADMCIDPVIIACSIVVRLQSIVNKEVRPEEFAVVSCSSIHGGSAANIVPEHVDLKITTRSYNLQVHERLQQAVLRIIRAECDISGAPAPQIKTLQHAPATINDEESSRKLKREFDAYFGDESAPLPAFGASEDFSYLANAVGAPYVFYMFGCLDPELWDQKERDNKLHEMPHHHTSNYTPVIQPTLKNALDAFALSALTFLGPSCAAEGGEGT